MRYLPETKALVQPDTIFIATHDAGHQHVCAGTPAFPDQMSDKGLAYTFPSR